MTNNGESITDRKIGKVIRTKDDFGFISCADIPGKDLYFKVSWFRGSPPLHEGDYVTFALKSVADKLQAHNLRRLGEQPAAVVPAVAGPSKAGLPRSDYLLDWAYFGYFPKALIKLKDFALQEDWDFKDSLPDPDHPYPILYSYLLHTFGRLVLEKKIGISSDMTVAAFNTGLVDPRYEPIYALFTPNKDPRTPWEFRSFCVAGEGNEGQALVRNFSQLPLAAHYFDNPLDLLFDTRASKPELDWRHVIVDRIGRYPTEFVEDHWPAAFTRRDISGLSDGERERYYSALGSAIEQDSRTYRRIISRVKDAIDLSIKRVRWNYKTAIPTYYPRVKKVQLLLPVCLLSDDKVDLALAVEKTPAGSYLGHTMLPLDWAYKIARLVCRPDSDWLAPKDISAVEGEEDV